MSTWRRLYVAVLASAVAWATTVVAPANARTDHGRWPSFIGLPDGFRPEGIAIGEAPVAYVGSLADGDIYAADLRTGSGRVVSEGPGTPSAGLKIDHRGRLFVAGGSAGDARLVDVDTGAVLTRWVFASGDTFVNDVVLAQQRAWFTDSRQPVLYGVPLGRGDASGTDVVRLALTWEWNQVAAGLNANGIDTTPDRRGLLVVNATTGQLFRVDPGTGAARVVDLGGALLTDGDGLLRIGRTLYVVQNQLNLVTKVALDARGSSGRVTGRYSAPATAGNPGFDVPSTVATYGNRLYLPNARFATTPTPQTRYWLTAVRRF